MEYIKKFIELYPERVLITAIPLYIIHIIKPYSHLDKFPYDDPPPKFLGTFSLGQLIQYIIQILSFPVILFIAAAMQLFLKLSENIQTLIFLILGIIWWAIPKWLARQIDGW